MPKGGGAMIWKAHHAKVQVLRISSPPIGERRNFFSRFGMRATELVSMLETPPTMKRGEKGL